MSLIGAITFTYGQSKQTEKKLNNEIKNLIQKKQSQDAAAKKSIQEQQQQIDQLKKDLQAKRDNQESLLAKAVDIVAPQALAFQVAPTVSTGCPSSSAKLFIYCRESGNNPAAINASSGACGLGQALPCSKLPCSLSDYTCQDNWFTYNYMIPRYGSWEVAKVFWLNHLWW